MEQYTTDELKAEIIRRRTEAEHRFLPATTTLATAHLKKIVDNIETIKATARGIDLDTQTEDDVKEMLGVINRSAYTAMCKIDQNQNESDKAYEIEKGKLEMEAQPKW